MNKESARLLAKESLMQLDFDQRRLEQAQVKYQFLQSTFWRQVDRIGMTYPMALEFDLREILETCLQAGKQVYLPKVRPGRRLAWYPYQGQEALVANPFGLLEPSGIDPAIPIESIQGLIVPGLAYQTGGHRLGFGGGYFDRILATYQGMTLSLAYQCQILPQGAWPIQEHDQVIQTILVGGNPCSD